MNCSDKDTCNSCISDILKKILILQKQEFDCDNYLGCDKPFLGPTISNVCYNTRPIQLYNCCSGNPWTFDYTLADGTTGTSNTFRIESLDDCCTTCRLLAENDDNTFTNTNQFVTIDLTCCGAIRCLTDIYLDLC